MSESTNQSLGRFDKSFLVHMIKDFFLVLILVTILEFSLKAGGVYWEYVNDGENQAMIVAEELAENVQSIMLNEGGPVAARTMYPILNKNWTDLGYEIGIVPSEITVKSIEENYDYTPEGIAIRNNVDQEHKSARVDIRASQFCTSCHSDAEVGDVLGHVLVRNYLARDFERWWDDVRVTLGLAVGKIVLHSILLFLILKSRMEPLLRLRAVVSALSKAYTNLDQRAEVKTADEFGVLARDLNLFLDRIGVLVKELDTVLTRVVEVNDDIVQIQSELHQKIDGVVLNTRALERGPLRRSKFEPRLSNAWFDAVKNSISQLDVAITQIDGAPEAKDVVNNLRAVVISAETQIENSEKMYISLAELGDEAQSLKGTMSEMSRLEERMKSVIETGTGLVRRLRPQDGNKAK